MRNIRFLWCFSLVLGLASALAAQDRGLTVVARELAGSANCEIGRQVAVIIGIDGYREWLPLKNAVAEARQFKQILAENYWFDEFIELYDADATVSNIRRIFTQTLPAKLGVHDSLLVFYAGHGHLDESKSGFWIPVDGSSDQLAQTAWLPNAQLRNYLGQLKAQRILVVADSCFSGDLLNTSRGAAPIIDSAYYRQALQLTSRQVLSSGSSETGPDESEFASGLLNFLTRNTEPYIDTMTIFERLRKSVTRTLPLFGTLPGNEQGGSFVFFRRQAEKAAPPPASAVAPASPATSTSTLPAIIRISASGAFNAWALPADMPQATPVPLVDGSQLSPGTWTICARLPDDNEATWTQTMLVPAGTETRLILPTLPYSKPYQLKSLGEKRTRAVSQQQALEEAFRTQQVFGWISLGLGLAGGGLGIFGGLDGSTNYLDYKGATSESSASAARARLQTDTALLYAGCAVGAAGIVVAPLLWFIDPVEPARMQVRDIDHQIELLSR